MHCHRQTGDSDHVQSRARKQAGIFESIVVRRSLFHSRGAESLKITGRKMLSILPRFRYACYMIFQEIALEQIGFEDETFRLSEQLDFTPVRDSLREVGQINPVVLLDGHPQMKIVCGFRRLRALKQLNKSHALARILDSKAVGSRNAFDLALWDNLSHRQLDPLEKARAAFLN